MPAAGGPIRAFGPGQDVAKQRPRAREGNRTLDLRITSASLCRLSYSGLHPRSVADLLDRRLVVTPPGALELHRRIFKDHTSAGLAVTVRV